MRTFRILNNGIMTRKGIMKKSQGNLIALMIFSLLFAFAADANVLVRTNGTTQYIPGQKAVGPNIDADFNNIVNWLNNGNIGSNNLTQFGVGPSNLAQYNVTITNGSSAFLMSGVTPVQVTNFSVSFVASGFRPVKVSLEPNPSPFLYNGIQNYGSVMYGSTAGSDVSNIYMVRDGSTVTDVYLSSNLLNAAVSAVPAYFQTPCSAFTYTDLPSAGSHSYIIYASASTSRGVAGVFNCRMVVEEL